MRPTAKAPVETLPDWQAAYIAGMLDGEGSFYVALRRHKIYGTRGYSYSPCIAVTSTNGDVLRVLQKWTQLGSLNRFDRGNPKWAPYWRWDLSCQMAGHLIRLVSKFLIIKKRQAALLLELVEFEATLYRTQFKKHPQSVWDVREAIYKKSKTLNKRS